MIQRIQLSFSSVYSSKHCKLKNLREKEWKMVYINSSIHTIPTAIADNIISTSFLK